MNIAKSPPHYDDIPEEIASLLVKIDLRQPLEVKAKVIVKAIFTLQEVGKSNLADRLIAHLIVPSNGYVNIVEGLSKSWAQSGHNGSGWQDFMQQTLLVMMRGLKNGQKSALNWSSFCYARFKDAKAAPELNGDKGKRAKRDKALYRAGDKIRSASTAPFLLDTFIESSASRDSGGGNDETGSSFSEEYSLGADSHRSEASHNTEPVRLKGVTLENENTDEFDEPVGVDVAASDEWEVERDLLALLVELRATSDPEEIMALEDLERWGRRVLGHIIDQIPDLVERNIAREMLVEDPPHLTGGPNDLGDLSVAARLGIKDHQAKYRFKKARLFIAKRLYHDYIEGGKLGQNDALERDMLKAWYEEIKP